MAASKTNNIQNTYADDILYSQVPNDRNMESVINSELTTHFNLLWPPPPTTSQFVILFEKNITLIYCWPPPPTPHHFMEVINISKEHNIFN